MTQSHFVQNLHPTLNMSRSIDSHVVMAHCGLKEMVQSVQKTASVLFAAGILVHVSFFTSIHDQITCDGPDCGANNNTFEEFAHPAMLRGYRIPNTTMTTTSTCML